jgi:hypothetical protein
MSKEQEQNQTELLKKFLDNGADWQKLDTDEKGIKIVRIKATKTRPALLGMEFNPIHEDGRPYKRFGLIVISKQALTDFLTLMSKDNVYPLFDILDTLNKDVLSQKKQFGVLKFE